MFHRRCTCLEPIISSIHLASAVALASLDWGEPSTLLARGPLAWSVLLSSDRLASLESVTGTVSTHLRPEGLDAWSVFIHTVGAV